jgi:membrane peptidoglycan carboxypeptidase
MDDRDKLYDEATKVTAKDGEVILDGPDGVDVKLTPEAANETSDRLLEAASQAAGQRKRKELGLPK